MVFVLADDLGWADLGCYGSTFYNTPHIDALAKTGTRFTQAYAACGVCSPTRASILTGKYPARLHLTDWLPGQPDSPRHKLNRPDIQNHLASDEVTVSKAFKDAGYQTCFIGKWHLGDEAHGPLHQGFDFNIAGGPEGHPPSYFSPYKLSHLKDGPKGEFLTDRLTDEAIRFVKDASTKGTPFFLYFAHYAVHTPLQARADRVAYYREKAARLPKPSSSEFIQDNGHPVRQIQNQPVYAAMVESLDESVGRIMETLRSLGLEENTIVIFTSDNGGLSTAEGSPTSNLPLRAGKGWPYEGGIREPLIVRWSGATSQGTTCETPVISPDYFPTLLEMAGLPAQPDKHVDGCSFGPLLKGGALAERPLFWHYPHYANQGGKPHGIVLSGDYKRIEWYEDGRAELYNLREDIGEQHDLSAQMPDKEAGLNAQFRAWLKRVGAQMPSPNPEYRPQ